MPLTDHEDAYGAIRNWGNGCMITRLLEVGSGWHGAKERGVEFSSGGLRRKLFEVGLRTPGRRRQWKGDVEDARGRGGSMEDNQCGLVCKLGNGAGPRRATHPRVDDAVLRNFEHTGRLFEAHIAHLGGDDLLDAILATLDLLSLLADVREYLKVGGTCGGNVGGQGRRVRSTAYPPKHNPAGKDCQTWAHLLCCGLLRLHLLVELFHRRHLFHKRLRLLHDLLVWLRRDRQSHTCAGRKKTSAAGVAVSSWSWVGLRRARCALVPFIPVVAACAHRGSGARF
eukprot:scaffold41444_cov31-Tisochrysis_lutea.AAC.7